MKTVRVLDCTLRDGGYVNEWNFGRYEKRRIIAGLAGAGIDIIECGYLSDQAGDNPDSSIFGSIQAMESFFDMDMGDTMGVCMIDQGQFDVRNLPVYGGGKIRGIRLAFHKDNLGQAMEEAGTIREKGYLVFFQAMVSLNYTDSEFLHLIECCNRIRPYAFYIVDSFGNIRRRDVVRLFYMIEHNLAGDTRIGFHSHNNLQMAFLNAQALVDIRSDRELIVDTSIHGMGRGAGNLNTELFVHFLNDNYGKRYDIRPIVAVIDAVISDIYDKKYWGYSIPNYLSAMHNCHPNYALYLDNKKALTFDDMNAVFNMMPPEQKKSFDRAYIESLYVKYMTAGTEGEEKMAGRLLAALAGRTILVIGAGPSSGRQKTLIAEWAGREDVTAISINHFYKYCDIDFVFVGNRRRYDELEPADRQSDRLIVTSNVTADTNGYMLDYARLLNGEGDVADNSGLMLIKLLIRGRAGKVLVAGLDGYTEGARENFADPSMRTHMGKTQAERMNAGMKRVLGEYRKEIPIEFITGSALDDENEP